MDDAIIALELAYHLQQERLGRRRLAERTGLTEMVVRSELERMREHGWIVLPRSGAELTSVGRRRFGPLLAGVRAVRSLKLETLRLDDVALAGLVTVNAPPTAWGLRDCAIREGGSGLLLFVRYDTEWAFSHDAESIRSRNPSDAAAIEAAFPQAMPKDYLIVTFARSCRTAATALWHAMVASLRERPHA